MVATVGSIQVALGADLRAYEAALRKGEKRTDDFERRANRSAAGVGEAFVKMGGLAKAAIAGLAGGLVTGGVTALIGEFRDIARNIATIGDEAKRAGISVKSLQEWKFVAEQNRVAVDALVDGFKELNLRADEFITSGGKAGSAAEAFQRLGYTAEELKLKLQDPSELLLEIIGRLGQMEKAAQIRIADELFGGTAGERFVELLDQGEQGIRDTIARAHELGIVLDEQIIERAAEIDRKFNEIAQSVGTNLKGAIVSAADSLVDFIDRFRAFENQRTATLDNRLREIGLERLDLERKIIDLREQQRAAWGPMAESERRVIEGYIIDAQNAMQRLADEEARILNILKTRTEPVSKPTDRTWTPPTLPTSDAGGRNRDRAALAAEREAEAVRRVITELEEELRLIGATDLERDIANELRRAGAAATEEQRARIVSLVAALHAEAEAQRQATEAANLYRDIAGGVLSDLRNALADGKLDWQELGEIAVRALNRIVDKLLDDVLDALFQVNTAARGIGFGGSGGVFNLLGGIVGETYTLPGAPSGGRFERIDDLAKRVIPAVQDLGVGAFRGDCHQLDVTADPEPRRLVRCQRIDVGLIAHGGHNADRVRPQAVAA